VQGRYEGKEKDGEKKPRTAYPSDDSPDSFHTPNPLYHLCEQFRNR
jgi:hypothetical protein